MLELKHVSYSYQSYQEEIFSDVNYQFANGTFYSIIGQSGAGKSTLLSLLAGLDNPKKGQVLFDGEDIQTKGSSYHRKHHVSLVFQNYNLIDYMTPLENVRLVNKQAGKEILLELGLDETQIKRNVLQLSGGQQQRVAIARALVSEAPVILADEPTGALDSKASRMLLNSFEVLNKSLEATILMVTHDAFTASFAHRILFIKDGRIFNELIRGEDDRKTFFNRIIEVVSLLGGDTNNVL